MHHHHPNSSPKTAHTDLWRVSNLNIPATPACEDTMSVGSDADWQYKMASDSEVSDPIVPQYQLNPMHPSTVVQHHSQHPQPNPQHVQFTSDLDENELPQPSIIPGYHGVNTRAALPSTSEKPTHQRSHSFPHFHQPRTSESHQSHTYPNLVHQHNPQHSAPNSNPHNSSQILPTPPTAKKNIDTAFALSSNPNSTSSPFAPNSSPSPSSSDSSHESQKVSSKSVSSVMANCPKPPLSSLVDDASRLRISSGQGFAPSSGHASSRSSGSLFSGEHRLSAIRMPFRESKVRLGGTRLAVSKANQKRGNAVISSGDVSPIAQIATSSTRPATFFTSPNLVPSSWSDAPHTNLHANRPLSTQSEGVPSHQQGATFSQYSTTAQRPLSTPNHSVSAFQEKSKGGLTDVFIEQAAFTTIADSKQQSESKAYQMSMKPTSRDMSFLECVVEVLKGATVLKRKNFIHAHEATIWLTTDMKAVKYRITKKGSAPVDYTLSLSRVRKLKGTERDISLEMMDEKKPFDFVFPSRERAEIWLSGLCCLVPAHASVKSRNRRWQQRATYDPLLDSWNGKPLATRKQLKEFILLGSIGRGSFGKVKLAFSSVERKFFAVKVLSKAMMRKRNRVSPLQRSARSKIDQSGQFTAAHVNEIAVMQRLDHDNVMRMRCVFDNVEEDRLYIVIEYLAKGPIMSSSKLTGARRLTENRARSAFVDVLTGLDYLHQNNIAHRDIKPDNLLESGDGTVKISDFGAAVLYEGENIDGDENQGYDTVGTPAFTAPELCISDNSPRGPGKSFAADIWSLGATLFYMVYGRAPFYARSVFEMYDAICNQEFGFPDTPAVSKSLQSLIRRMLEKDPYRRATVAEISESPWLTESVEVAEKLLALRRHIAQRSAVMGNATTAVSSV